MIFPVPREGAIVAVERIETKGVGWETKDQTHAGMGKSMPL